MANKTNQEVLRQLHTAIIDAFTPQQLMQVISLEFGIQPELISSWQSNFAEIAWNVIRYFENHDQIGELMFALLIENPQNEKIKAVNSKYLRLVEKGRSDIIVNGRADDIDEFLKILKAIRDDMGICKLSLEKLSHSVPTPWSRTEWLLLFIGIGVIVSIALALLISV